jgi:hypothetical protein
LLLTTELKLIEVASTQYEKSLALTLSIPYKEPSLTEDPQLTMQLQFLPKELMQWRILCFLEKLSSDSALPQKGLCLSVRYCDQVTSFPMDDGPLNCMRVNYVYLAQQRSPKQFFSSFQAEVRITKGTEWSNWIAKSSIAMLKDFPADLLENQALVQSMHSVLFNRRQEPLMTLSLKAGVSSDYPVSSKIIKSLMNKQADIYFPEPTYCTADPLPSAWMELFDQYQEPESWEEELQDDNYLPTLTHNDMLRMEDITSPMKKLKPLAFNANHVPFNRLAHKHAVTGQEHQQKSPARVPKLSLGKLTASTGVEVKKLHSTVSEYLQKRPGISGYTTGTASERSVSALRLRTFEQTLTSTQRSSLTSSSASSRTTPLRTRKVFRKQMGIIKQLVGEEI